MGDFKLFVGDLAAEIEVTNGEPTMTGGFTSAVLISLFTEINIDGSVAWWADSVSTDSALTGGRFFTIFTAKNTNDNLNQLHDFALESLQWLIDDGIAKAITFSFVRLTNKLVSITITITQPDNTETNVRFNINWEKQSIEVIQDGD